MTWRAFVLTVGEYSDRELAFVGPTLRSVIAWWREGEQANAAPEQLDVYEFDANHPEHPALVTDEDGRYCRPNLVDPARYLVLSDDRPRRRLAWRPLDEVE